MKKRIGNLRGKPIIEGDKNLMTPNELHIDSLGNSDNEGGGREGSSFYLKLKTPQKDKNILQLQSQFFITTFFKIGEAKTTSDLGITILPYSTLVATWEGFTLTAFEVCPRKKDTSLGATPLPKYDTLEDLLTNISIVSGEGSKEQIKEAILDPHFEIITEEEFYSLI